MFKKTKYNIRKKTKTSKNQHLDYKMPGHTFNYHCNYITEKNFLYCQINISLSIHSKVF